MTRKSASPKFMGSKVLQKAFDVLVIAAGGLAVAWAFTQLNYGKIDLGFLLLTIFTLTVASRMQLRFPRSNLVFTFADAMIFLAFLFYGGGFAIILASLEFLTSSVRIKSRNPGYPNSSILFNVNVIAISTTITYLGYLAIFPTVQNSGTGFATSAYLLSVLGTMALTQFFVNSTLIAGYIALHREKRFWKIWLDQMLPGSITHIAGATSKGATAPRANLKGTHVEALLWSPGVCRIPRPF